ncbi:hypothetical protein [Methylococcus sp. EFPC2]|uniref:hypothetical protein n=1 Tax=Methylococcus sp. EFPC2 TaxID=2812648 RepID=UPI00196881FE|nr:hypothetical protein [Methylococcus sp. EFPC2]QSA95758.1 hypothetical protein JWZ97_10905 [Methylococcus sp. EFPC2]
MKRLTPHLLPVLASLLLSACAASTPKTTAPAADAAAAAESKPANDYPTLTRVEFVLECAQEQPGGLQNRDNIYHCACAADQVAEKLGHEDYAQAQTFTYNFGAAGERAAEFRDPPQSAKLRNALKEAKAQAASACFLKPVGKK